MSTALLLRCRSVFHDAIGISRANEDNAKIAKLENNKAVAIGTKVGPRGLGPALFQAMPPLQVQNFQVAASPGFRTASRIIEEIKVFSCSIRKTFIFRSHIHGGDA